MLIAFMLFTINLSMYNKTTAIYPSGRMLTLSLQSTRLGLMFSPILNTLRTKTLLLLTMRLVLIRINQRRQGLSKVCYWCDATKIHYYLVFTQMI